MLSITQGARAPRLAVHVNASPKANSTHASDLADAQANLAAALIAGNDVVELREEVATLQAAKCTPAATTLRKAFSPNMNAGQIALGVTAQHFALSK